MPGLCICARSCAPPPRARVRSRERTLARRSHLGSALLRLPPRALGGCVPRFPQRLHPRDPLRPRHGVLVSGKDLLPQELDVPAQDPILRSAGSRRGTEGQRPPTGAADIAGWPLIGYGRPPLLFRPRALAGDRRRRCGEQEWSGGGGAPPWEPTRAPTRGVHGGGIPGGLAEEHEAGQRPGGRSGGGGAGWAAVPVSVRAWSR